MDDQSIYDAFSSSMKITQRAYDVTAVQKREYDAAYDHRLCVHIQTIRAYLLELSQRSMLPYEDDYYIERWLRTCHLDLDRLLLVLDDVYTDYYQKKGQYPKYLHVINRRVMQRLWIV